MFECTFASSNAEYNVFACRRISNLIFKDATKWEPFKSFLSESSELFMIFGNCYN